MVSQSVTIKIREPHDARALTPSELETLAEIARGYSNQEIAARRFVSVNTVRAHVRSLMGKLACRNRTQLALLYVDNEAAFKEALTNGATVSIVHTTR